MNWQEGTPPQNGNDIVFPANPCSSQLLSFDDIPALSLSHINSLQISSCNFDIGGVVNVDSGITVSGPQLLQGILIFGGITSDQEILCASTNGASLLSVTGLNLNGHTLTIDGSCSVHLQSSFADSGAIVKSGNAPLFVDKFYTNTYQGLFTVKAGIVDVEGTIPAVNIVNGILLGNGTVGTITTLGGTIYAGAVPNQFITPIPAPGVLNAGPLQLGSGIFAPQLNGTAQYSQIKTTGPVSLNGISLSPTLGYTPSPSDSFRIIDNTGSSSVSGSFTGLSEGSRFYLGGYYLQITYVGGTGNDVVLTTVNNSGAQSTVTIMTSVNPDKFRTDVTVTATVSSSLGTPTGTVAFFDGNQMLGYSALSAGVATWRAHFSPGVHSLTAAYGGDASNAGSLSTTFWEYSSPKPH